MDIQQTRYTVVFTVLINSQISFSKDYMRKCVKGGKIRSIAFAHNGNSIISASDNASMHLVRYVCMLDGYRILDYLSYAFL